MKLKIAGVTIPVLPRVKPKTTSPQEEANAAIKSFLSRFERAELALAQIRQENEALFNRIEFHEAEKAECLASIRRLAYTKDGPPAGVELRGKTAWPAVSRHFGVKVVYKKHSDYYDPSALPELVLRAPGVVKEVDFAAVNALLNSARGTRGEVLTRGVAEARREGEWMTPSVTIERLRTPGEPLEGF